MGLASLVFPGADYSRFAHGVGTLYVTGRILDSLAKAYPGDVTEEEVRLYRMAALLHDIGHYPFSHTFERALKDFYIASDVLQPKASTPASDPSQSEVMGDTPVGVRWLHEELGRHVILEDRALRKILKEHDLAADELTRIIERSDPPKFTNLVSSDLDADRVDYLLRTAKHTGLPYGNVDLEYLLSQICLDAQQHICVRPKGLRAAEHVLICRYFDYRQVNFHKTVAGLELVLNDAIGALLRSRALSVTQDDLQNMIDDGRWYSFDDAYIISLMREARDETQSRDTPRYSATEKLLFEAILDRNPPKLVAERERLGPASHLTVLQGLRHNAKRHIEEWEERFGVRFYIWSPSAARITKIGASVPASVLEDQADGEPYDQLQQAIRILVDETASKPIQECGNSLLSVLGSQALYSIRIYALVPQSDSNKIAEIRSVVNDELGPIWSKLVD